MTEWNKILENLEKKGLRRRLWTMDAVHGLRVRSGNHELWNFSSNNYLNLADDPRLKAAALEAIEQWGTGSGAARLISGNFSLYDELEAELARFKGAEATLVFNSGYQLNTGVIPALACEGDVIFSDELNHASLIDGIRLSRARVEVFRHNDMNHLEELLKKNPSKKTIVTESVFSMDGDLAPVGEILGLAEKYDALVYLDEAHATGVTEQQVLSTQIIRMGTLGKALGSFGAYVAGSRELCDFLINRCRSFIFTTALPPASVAAALEAVRIVQAEPQLQEKLWENIRFLKKSLEQIGMTSGGKSAIFPIVLGQAQQAVKISEKLFEAGFLVQAIRPPTVPEGTSRLRLTVSAGHSTDVLAGLVKNLGSLLILD